MLAVTPEQRRALRARAHQLRPVVMVGHHGLTPAVLHEIDFNLTAHELIKVRVFGDARAERAALLERICTELGAASVQHIGKLLVLWRPAPEPPAPPALRKHEPAITPKRRGRHRIEDEHPRNARGKPKGDAMAKSAPQARRPRDPTARAPARPPVPSGPRRPRSGPAVSTGRRRGRGTG